MAMKYTISDFAANEALAVRMPFPVFSGLPEVHKIIMKGCKEPPTTRYILSCVEVGPTKIYYGLFVEKKGGLLKKATFEFVEETVLNDDAYLALRQFYFQVRAALYDKNFNVVDILVEVKDAENMGKVQYAIAYDAHMDAGNEDSHTGSKHVAGGSAAKIPSAGSDGVFESVKEVPKTLSSLKY